ncbi:hypothetical protein GCM10027290_11430 [Micromonospora sonneratiae]
MGHHPDHRPGGAVAIDDVTQQFPGLSGGIGGIQGGEASHRYLLVGNHRIPGRGILSSVWGRHPCELVGRVAPAAMVGFPDDCRRVRSGTVIDMIIAFVRLRTA